MSQHPTPHSYNPPPPHSGSRPTPPPTVTWEIIEVTGPEGDLLHTQQTAAIRAVLQAIATHHQRATRSNQPKDPIFSR